MYTYENNFEEMFSTSLARWLILALGRFDLFWFLVALSNLGLDWIGEALKSFASKVNIPSIQSGENV